MEDKILDAPLGDSFESYLTKGETILWRGTPSYHSLLKDDNYYPPGMRLSELKIIHSLLIFSSIIGCQEKDQQ